MQNIIRWSIINAEIDARYAKKVKDQLYRL